MDQQLLFQQFLRLQAGQTMSSGLQENENINPQLLSMYPMMTPTPSRQYHPSEGGMGTPTIPNIQPAMIPMSGMTVPPTPAPPVVNPVMSEMQNTIAELKATVALLSANSEAAAAAAQANASIAAEQAAIKLKTTHAIQAAMKGLLGVNAAADNLPPPLAPNEHFHLAPDGTRLWNPEWYQPSTTPLNDEYLQAVIDLIIDQDKQSLTSNLGSQGRQDLIKMARQYFRTLRDKFKAQTTDRGQERSNTKNSKTKLRARKKKKCDNLRKRIPDFKAAYGEENCVGLEEVLLTDYMSSEHSDAGNVDEEAFNTYRRQMGGGSSGLEVRRLAWRSSMLNRVYGRLRTFQRRAERQAAAANAGKKRARQGKARIPRFVGMPANTNNGCPADKKGRPYQACVSEAWAVETGNTSLPMSGDPASYSLFKLKISKDDLDEEDRLYLGDDEDSDSDTEEDLTA